MRSSTLILPFFFSLASARLFTVTNACPFTIWPAVWTNTSYGTAKPSVEGGWEAPTNSSKQFAVPGESATPRVCHNTHWFTDNWAAGRIWARRGCNFANSQGPESCVTGGCAGGLNCTESGSPPITLAEWTLSPTNDRDDYYDVSLLDGFDLPVRITPSAQCAVAECAVDLIANCPQPLRVPTDPNQPAQGCTTSCFANLDGNPGNSANCCTGQFDTQESCPASKIAFFDYFRGSCPTAYAWTFDGSNRDIIKNCPGTNKADYTVTFCPPAQ
ncbi:unnamed protein product [Rhizoctonia solani]|uniref:Thaumatin-like protein 1 n=1 Tax=Rhizoctonia solani TaxID=456999 RepID=A0A8H3GC18_9AGAM|nr:unnamed protein product [Rhizoctonia solani]